MAAAAEPLLITVEQYRQIPEIVTITSRNGTGVVYRAEDAIPLSCLGVFAGVRNLHVTTLDTVIIKERRQPVRVRVSVDYSDSP